MLLLLIVFCLPIGLTVFMLIRSFKRGLKDKANKKIINTVKNSPFKLR